ncbi:hypothetical protein ETB97_007496 [Aspergillus alliaceus]|uniref:Uncharacterized protein n=1 Tax=Petromyces alliaceus TaxID=209559 RepID=A0A8H6E2P5_PETAA|nr:hypothetical protein ETB97_007496 [Aspergillus burnettii]
MLSTSNDRPTLPHTEFSDPKQSPLLFLTARMHWKLISLPAIAAKQRNMDFGNLRLNQGVDLYPELRCGSWERDRGKPGTVLSWTSGEGDTEILRYLLGAAAIDGLVYGYPNSEYNDESGAKSALQDIVDFVECHPDTHRMATRYDLPW